MRVRISYVVVIDDEMRRGIREHYGQSGLASREDVKRWYEAFGTSGDDDLAWSIDPDNPDLKGPA